MVASATTLASGAVVPVQTLTAAAADCKDGQPLLNVATTYQVIEPSGGVAFSEVFAVFPNRIVCVPVDANN